MINFVIYEDKEIVRKSYVKMIHKFMGKSDSAYKIYEFNSYTNKTKEYISNNIGYNIYILDIEVPGKSGLDLAREIRNTGDWKSQIVIVTSHDDLKNFDIEYDEALISETEEKGNYGPYKQSLRGDIYQAYAKYLLDDYFLITNRKNDKINPEKYLESLLEKNYEEELLDAFASYSFRTSTASEIIARRS